MHISPKVLGRVVGALGALACSFQVAAADIASCSDPSGKGYYPEIGLMEKKDSGWSDEKISGGITKVIKLADGEYDILFVDVRKDIVSARQDGARILLLSQGKNIFSLLVIFPGAVAEVYTFLKNNSGKLEYMYTVTKSGDGVLIAKASVMRGECSYINFEAL